MTAQAGDTLIPELAARKSALRQAQRQLRRAIPERSRATAARRAAAALLRRLGRRRLRIAIYLSVHSELSTAPLRAALTRAGHAVYTPLILPHSRMRFVPLRAHAPLRHCALGLPRPVDTRGRRSARAMDVVLLPLLAFDARGARLGNGGGYYDRALSRRLCARRPWQVGYAYAAQEVAHVPCEPWDVRLDAVATERGLRRFRQP